MIPATRIRTPHAHHQLQRERPALGREQGLLRLVRRAGCRRARGPGDQGAGAPARRSRVPSRRVQGLVPRRHDEEGLQRRRHLFEARTGRDPHRARLGRVRRGGALHRGALRQPQRGLVLHSLRFVRRTAPGLQVRGHGMAAADPRPVAGQRPRLRALRRLEHRPQRARHPQLEVEPEELRLPAARARVAQRPVLRHPRLGGYVPRAEPRGPGLHLVEQPRRRARQGRRLAHRLPVRDPVAARAPARLLDRADAALLRPRAVHRGLRPVSATNEGAVSYKGWSGIKRAFATPSAFTLLVFGFGSGLPFLLIASMTLSTRLRDVGLDLGSIGLISLASFFYLLKFLWAPLIDRFPFPLTAFLGRRRSWLLVSQLLVGASLAALALTRPEMDVTALVCWVLVGSFAGA